MFRRLQFDSLQDWLAIIALLVSFSLFIYFLYRVLRMRKKDIDRLSNLPLEDDSKKKEKQQDERKE